MNNRVSILRSMLVLYRTNPKKYFSVSEINNMTDTSHRATFRAVSSLHQMDYLELNSQECAKNLLIGRKVVRKFRINPDMMDEVEMIIK